MCVCGGGRAESSPAAEVGSCMGGHPACSSNMFFLMDLAPMLPLTCRRYVAAVELLGERDEALEELRADLQDVKHLYK